MVVRFDVLYSFAVFSDNGRSDNDCSCGGYTMIAWLTNILGSVPTDYQFIVYLGATALVVLCVVCIFNALFMPFRMLK